MATEFLTILESENDLKIVVNPIISEESIYESLIELD